MSAIVEALTLSQRRLACSRSQQPLDYCASPIWRMNSWLSQYSHSSFMTPFSHRPIVTMASLKALLVAAMVLPTRWLSDRLRPRGHAWSHHAIATEPAKRPVFPGGDGLR